jgi:membrane protease YdiL (CAAX protease family)
MERQRRTIAMASKCTVLLALSAALTCNAFTAVTHLARMSSSVISAPSLYRASSSSSIHSIKGTRPRAYTTQCTISLPLRIAPTSPSSALRFLSKPRKNNFHLPALPSDSADERASAPANPDTDSPALQFQTIALLVGAQSLLLPISAVLAKILSIPNSGLGVGFAWNSNAVLQGIQWTAPLFVVAGIMQLLEPYSSAVQGVTKATQRSVLAVMGRKRRPGTALLVSILLGTVAGWGEEWLFRGVFQTLLTDKFSSQIGLGVSCIVFGLLHAVTPVYALLAGLASLFFGKMYIVSQNLAVPMVCHAVYDIAALMWAHWSATGLSSKEQDDILEVGPGVITTK